MTNAECRAIYNDNTKRINDNISWSEDEDHSPSVEFRREIQSDVGYPIFVHGSYNRAVNKLSYVMIHRSSGCIFRLCMGSDHHNPSCSNVGGDRHIHEWDEITKDKEAYPADMVTADVSDPIGIWEEFCELLNITHVGVMHSPPIF